MPASRTTRMDAKRIIDVLDRQIAKRTRSLAMVETTWGPVAAVDEAESTVDVYLFGSPYASEGFRVLGGGGLPEVGDNVKAAIDRATGDRWIMEPIFAGDGGGVSSHDDLTGVSADDHHAQVHAIDGGNHTGSLGADEIDFTPFGSIAATDVQAAIEEVFSEAAGGVTDHGALTGLADDDHPQYATNTEFDDHSARHEDGGADEISIAGLSGEPAALTSHLGDTADAHDASAVSFDPTGLAEITATDVQNALEELDAAVAAAGGGPGEIALNYLIDGGATTIVTGIRPVVRLPYDCTVTAARAYANENGSIQIDVLRTTHSDYDMPSTHPVAGDSIIGSGTDITISGTDKYEDTSLDWDDVTLQEGDLIAFNVISATSIKKVSICLTLVP